MDEKNRFWGRSSRSPLSKSDPVRPTPPDLPPYDPEKEPPQWNWSRLIREKPVDKGTVPWTETGTQPDSPDKPDWRGIIRNNVIELPMPEPSKVGRKLHDYYFFFDTPDYADPFKKLWFSFKWFTLTGLMISCGKSLIMNHSCTLRTWRAHTRLVLAPWILGGMASTLTVCTVANLRGKKDGYMNYVLGGLVMAGIAGKRHWYNQTVRSVFFVPTAVYLKYAAETNGQILPVFNPGRAHTGISGFNAENGFFSGDWRFHQAFWGETGRDLRKTY